MELTVLVFLPAVVAATILLLPEEQEQNAKWLALAGSVATLALSLWLFIDFETGQRASIRRARDLVDASSFQLEITWASMG
jgi:NADH:ubiquinone oxidoreductase subunit 4 (subunit M)